MDLLKNMQKFIDNISFKINPDIIDFALCSLVKKGVLKPKNQRKQLVRIDGRL